jgi:diguanylate cyclase (GGDEF)-like protein
VNAAARCARGTASSIRAWAIWELPRWLTCFVITVIFTEIAAIGVAAAFTPLHSRDFELAGILVACSLVTVELTRRSGEPSGYIKDVNGVWYLPIAILLPPLYALLAVIPGVILTQLRVRKTVLYRRVFSATAIGLSYATASLAFHVIAPAIPGSRAGSGFHALFWTLIAAGCGLLRVMVNHALVLTAVKGSEPTTRVLPMVFGREPVFNDLAELCIGVLVAFAAAYSLILALYALPLIVLLQRSQRHAQLLDASRIDGKTGLLNAATWQREASLEVTRAGRTRTPLAVAMVDIDHFKSVNDTFGHLAGDAVLATLASTLRALLRDYDITGRFGGEEFAILLPQTGAYEACRIAERLREKVSKIVFPVTVGPDAGPLRITVSVGVATMDRARRDLDELIAAADLALYQAKSAGRDQIRMVSESTPDPSALSD